MRRYKETTTQAQTKQRHVRAYGNVRFPVSLSVLLGLTLLCWSRLICKHQQARSRRSPSAGSCAHWNSSEVASVRCSSYTNSPQGQILLRNRTRSQQAEETVLVYTQAKRKTVDILLCALLIWLCSRIMYRSSLFCSRITWTPSYVVVVA